MEKLREEILHLRIKNSEFVRKSLAQLLFGQDSLLEKSGFGAWTELRPV